MLKIGDKSTLKDGTPFEVVGHTYRKRDICEGCILDERSEKEGRDCTYYLREEDLSLYGNILCGRPMYILIPLGEEV